MASTVVRERTAGFVQITRFTNSLYSGGYTLVGAFLSGGASAALSEREGLAALVVGLVVAYGFVINDVRDVAVDRIGKPQRPIPSGLVSQREALIFALGLGLTALLVAAPLGWELLLFTLATILITGGYSLWLKSTVLWGNACMATLIAAIPLFGGLATDGANGAVLAIALLMWLFDFSHEILKTTADWQGDGAAGLRTVATVFGVGGAIRIFQLAASFFVLAALFPWLLGITSWPYGLAVSICGILPTLWVIVALARRPDDATITFTLRVMRWMWITNLLPILLFRMP